MADTRETKDLVASDPVARGQRGSAPLATLTFIGLRLLNPVVSYRILAHGLGGGLITRIGGRVLPMGQPASTGFGFIDSLGLSPYRLILLAMDIASSYKQAFFQTMIMEEPLKMSTAIAVPVFNGLESLISIFLFTWSATSASVGGDETFPQPQLLVGSTLFTVGLIGEMVAELQRKAFKKDPQNKGKAYTGGLFRITRHVNYTGNVLWRTGIAIAGSGFIWGSAIAAMHINDFLTRAIPSLDQYCSRRYGEQWTQFKKDTPYALLPGIV